MAEVALLTAYHLLLFRAFYFQNPYVYARSEALEQGFASSVLLGRALRRGRLPDDPYYYPDYRALPFLSAWYPPHLVQAWVGAHWGLNGAWLTYCLTMVLHPWLASLSVWHLWNHWRPGDGWTSIFAAVILSSLGYAWKQNSSIVYTMSWVGPLLLAASAHSWGLFGTSLGMMLLAGYWPVAYPATVVGCLVWLLGWPSLR